MTSSATRTASSSTGRSPTCARSAGSARSSARAGPTLHGRLREGGLADELFLTIAPKLAGGEAPRILEGALPEVVELQLAWLLESHGELFARYRL